MKIKTTGFCLSSSLAALITASPIYELHAATILNDEQLEVVSGDNGLAASAGTAVEGEAIEENKEQTQLTEEEAERLRTLDEDNPLISDNNAIPELDYRETYTIEPGPETSKGCGAYGCWNFTDVVRDNAKRTMTSIK